MSDNARLGAAKSTRPANPIDAERLRAQEGIAKGGPMAAFWAELERCDAWLASREEPEKPTRAPRWMRGKRSAFAPQVPTAPADDGSHDDEA